MHASHGFAVAKLRELLSREPGIGVDLRYVSNQTSLASLAHDGCDLAGMHLPQGELRQASIAAAKGWLTPGALSRDQLRHARDGADGASAAIRSASTSLERPARPGSPLRQPRSRFGDAACCSSSSWQQHGIDGARINGYEQVEFTHAAVAAYVASGMADVSFGVEAAARQFDLDFVRLVTEDYFFVCRKQLLDTEAMKRVLAIMRSAEFQAAVAGLPGYAASDAGMIKPVREIFRKTA